MAPEDAAQPRSWIPLQLWPGTAQDPREGPGCGITDGIIGCGITDGIIDCGITDGNNPLQGREPPQQNPNPSHSPSSSVRTMTGELSGPGPTSV